MQYTENNGDQEPFFSIITIVFNGVEYLEGTIQSVLRQSFRNFEYIIIDGGSTDGSVDLIKKYEGSLSCWVSEADRGISDAFNKGIARARGRFVGFINADDWYNFDTLRVAHSILHSDPSVDVLSGAVDYWENGYASHRSYSNPILLAKEMTINHPSSFTRRELFDRFGQFNRSFKYAMDYEFFLRVHSQANIASHDQAFANMRLIGVSHRNRRVAIKEVYLAKQEHLPKNRGLQILLYYVCQLLRSEVSHWLQALNLPFLVSFYRRRYSACRKENILRNEQ